MNGVLVGITIGLGFAVCYLTCAVVAHATRSLQLQDERDMFEHRVYELAAENQNLRAVLSAGQLEQWQRVSRN